MVFIITASITLTNTCLRGVYYSPGFLDPVLCVHIHTRVRRLLHANKQFSDTAKVFKNSTQLNSNTVYSRDRIRFHQ